MTVINSIGIEEVLNRLGLTEDQVRIIYTNEIDRLQKQEAVLIAQINENAKKLEGQYLERQKLSQAMDNERLDVENAKKAIIASKTEISDAQKALERDKRDVAALHVKLDEAKEAFRQERIVYLERLKKLEADEMIVAKKFQEVNDKDIALDNLRDELYLKKRDLDESLKTSEELTQKLASEKNDLLSLKILLDETGRALDSKKSENDAVEKSIERMMLEAKEQITADKEAFYAEKRATEESLRKREVEVARKEKFIEESEASIKRKLDETVIEEGRRRKK